MKALDNLKTGVKLIAAFFLVAALLGVVGFVGWSGVEQVGANQDTLYADRLVPIEQLAKVESALYRIRGNTYKALLLPEERDKAHADTAAAAAIVVQEMDVFRKTELLDAEVTGLKVFDAAWAEYSAAVAEIKAAEGSSKTMPTAIASLKDGGRASNARKAVDKAAVELIELNVTEAARLDKATDVQRAKTARTLTFLAIFGFVFAMAAGFVITRSITRPLSKGVAMMQEMAVGRLGTRLRLGRKDEIGVLADAMDGFAEDLQVKVVATMRKIADGDVSTDIVVKDAQDEIMPALKATTESLRGLIAEAGMLSKAAVEGRLATRGNAEKFRGGYRDIVSGVNETLDAVIGPLNVAAEYVDRISKGDIPPKITDSYNGDFNEIKNNLNTCIDALSSLVAEMNAHVEGARPRRHRCRDRRREVPRRLPGHGEGDQRDGRRPHRGEEEGDGVHRRVRPRQLRGAARAVPGQEGVHQRDDRAGAGEPEGADRGCRPAVEGGGGRPAGDTRRRDEAPGRLPQDRGRRERDAGRGDRAAERRRGVRGPDLARATFRRRSPTATTATSTRSRTT